MFALSAPVRLIAFIATLVVMLSACAPHSVRPETPSVPAGDGLAVTEVNEAFFNVLTPDLGVDSLGIWLSLDAQPWLIASAKLTGQLLVFDGNDGQLLHEIAPEEPLAYPNGLTVFGDYLFVVERDAARVQVFSLPDFSSLGSFGQPQLRSPYGIWLHETAPDEVEVYITDSYQEGSQLSPLTSLNQRIQRFRVRLNESPIRAFSLGAFGSTSPEHALHWVESIAGDPAFDRLVIAEEHADFSHAGLQVYSFDGQPLKEHLGNGLFQGDQEGVGLYECSNGSGYWIATDQHREHNRFHVFDRATLSYLGSFSGEKTRNTDGIALFPVASERFPYGVLYAVHDDQGVAAFDWQDIAQALNLWRDCIE